MKLLKPLACLVVIISFMTVQPSFSQSSSKFASLKFGNDKGDTLSYRQLTPDADRLRKYPLIIFLHGSGERGSDNEAQLKWGVNNFATDENMIQYPAIVIAPQCPANMTWSNFSRTDMKLLPDPSKPMALLYGLIQQSIKNLPVDTNRIYITGLSMGGFGTFDAIERYPHLFAAAVPVCGGGDTSRASSIAQLPIWIFHGAEDPAVDPALSVNMLQALVRAGAHPGFTQYPEVGHFSWLGAYSDKQMLAWLFRQRKK